MIQSKELSLKYIIGSEQGIHITSYLENKGNLDLIKTHLGDAIDIATKHLENVMPSTELKELLLPLKSLLSNERMLSNFKSNIGIFRNQEVFRIVALPIHVESLCVVATSFHVKPLLRWMQTDRDFLFLGMENDSASLYLGNQVSFKHVDSISLNGIRQKDMSNSVCKNLNLHSNSNIRYIAISDWVNEKLLEIPAKNNVPLFLAGLATPNSTFFSRIKYRHIRQQTISDYFDINRPDEQISLIRHILKKETQDFLQRSLIEFNWAEELKRGEKNIFKIAKAAVRGNIQKLIVADGIQIFGKLNKISGELSINPVHLDHEDDDLLDDLSQAVLSKGGEVVVLPKEQVPKGRLLLAILKGKPAKNDSSKINIQLPLFNYA